MPFITGIVLGLVVFEPKIVNVIPQASIIVLLSLLLVALNPLRQYSLRYWSGIWIWLFFIGLGLVQVGIRNRKQDDAEKLLSAHSMLVQLIDQPVILDKTYRALVRTEGYETGDGWNNRHYQFLGYFDKDSVSKHLKVGDHILVRVTPEKIISSGNPYEFNYRQYLTDKGIYGRFFAPAGSWERFTSHQGLSLVAISAGVRFQAIKTLERFLPETRVLSIASALIVGERDAIDDNLRDAFADAGIVHIMAVSGLHVGIIYIFLVYILGFLERIRNGRMIRSVIILFLLWFYAMVSGLNPPVLRATTMFSIIAVGQGLRRAGNVYNSLLVAAFLLLFINPLMIRNPGFLLSFFAVAGIIFLYPKIYNLVSFKLWLPNKIWMLACLSISAQLGTMPLVFYYFRQFPVYFMFSNLLAIPLVSVIIYLGFVTLLFSFIPLIAGILGQLLSVLIQALIYVSEAVSTLPYAVVKPIHISQTEVVLLYLFMVLLVMYLVQRKPQLLKAALATAILFTVTGLWIMEHHHDQRYLMVLNVRGCTVIQYIDGISAHLITRDTSYESYEDIKYAASGGWNRLRIRDTCWHSLEGNRTIMIPEANLVLHRGFIKAGKMVGYISGCQMNPAMRLASPGSPSIGIITGHDLWSSLNFIQFWKPDLAVIDASVPWYRIDRLKDFLGDAGVHYYIVPEDGAFVLDLKTSL